MTKAERKEEIQQVRSYHRGVNIIMWRVIGWKRNKLRTKPAAKEKGGDEM